MLTMMTKYWRALTWSIRQLHCCTYECSIVSIFIAQFILLWGTIYDFNVHVNKGMYQGLYNVSTLTATILFPTPHILLSERTETLGRDNYITYSCQTAPRCSGGPTITHEVHQRMSMYFHPSVSSSDDPSGTSLHPSSRIKITDPLYFHSPMSCASGSLTSLTFPAIVITRQYYYHRNRYNTVGSRESEHIERNHRKLNKLLQQNTFLFQNHPT